MGEIVGHNNKLYSSGNYFFNKFTESIKEDDRTKHFWTIIQCLVRFENDDCGGSFEVFRPVT